MQNNKRSRLEVEATIVTGLAVMVVGLMFGVTVYLVATWGQYVH